jgi:hypothetical protein
MTGNSGCQPLGVQGIEAEILFYRKAVKKIAADSPVFCMT